MAIGDRYQPGSVRAHLTCNENCDRNDDNDGAAYDYHDDGTELGTAELPHQCGGWVIGGAAEVRALIADLQAVLAQMEPGDDDGDAVPCGCCGEPATLLRDTPLACCNFCSERCRAPGPIDTNWYHGTIPVRATVKL